MSSDTSPTEPLTLSRMEGTSCINPSHQQILPFPFAETQFLIPLRKASVELDDTCKHQPVLDVMYYTIAREYRILLSRASEHERDVMLIFMDGLCYNPETRF